MSHRWSDQFQHEPLAYFLTFTCYGTWLHGDERGSKDRHHRAFQTPEVEADARRRERMQLLLAHPPVTLDREMRVRVQQAITETCAFRGWTVFALNVRTNHVHAVVAADCSAERALTTLKARATRRLVEAGVWPRGIRLWTRHGSTRFIWSEQSLAAVIEYVIARQGAKLT